MDKSENGWIKFWKFPIFRPLDRGGPEPIGHPSSTPKGYCGLEGILQAPKSNLATRMQVLFAFIYFDMLVGAESLYVLSGSLRIWFSRNDQKAQWWQLS